MVVAQSETYVCRRRRRWGIRDGMPRLAGTQASRGIPDDEDVVVAEIGAVPLSAVALSDAT